MPDPLLVLNLDFPAARPKSRFVRSHIDLGEVQEGVIPTPGIDRIDSRNGDRRTLDQINDRPSLQRLNRMVAEQDSRGLKTHYPNVSPRDVARTWEKNLRAYGGMMKSQGTPEVDGVQGPNRTSARWQALLRHRARKSRPMNDPNADQRTLSTMVEENDQPAIREIKRWHKANQRRALGRKYPNVTESELVELFDIDTRKPLIGG